MLGNLDILLTVRHYMYITHVQIYYIPLISIIYKYLQRFCVPSHPYTQSVKVPHLNVHTLMWFFPTYFLVLSPYQPVTLALSLSLSSIYDLSFQFFQFYLNSPRRHNIITIVTNNQSSIIYL